MSDAPECDGIREFQWPFRNPLDLVAELFCASRWQIGPEEAAQFAAGYLFDELLLRIGRDAAEKAFLHVIRERGAFSEDHEIRMLLFRLHMTRDKRTGKRKPNVQQLARMIVAENIAFNKSPDRNGQPARPTNQPTIEKQIIRIRNAHGAAFLAEMGMSPRPHKKKPKPRTAKVRAADGGKSRIVLR